MVKLIGFIEMEDVPKTSKVNVDQNDIHIDHECEDHQVFRQMMVQADYDIKAGRISEEEYSLILQGKI